jgi:hypothetical protein
MRTKLVFSTVVLGVLLTAGCSTNHESIYFASEVKVPAMKEVVSPVVPGLSKTDEEKIDLLILSYLLDRHFWEDGNYSALFMQAEDSVVKALITKYPNHIPPIKESYHIDLHSNQSPLDKDTGLPVMILGVDMSDPKPDGSVDVIGRWYAGGVVQGSKTFLMKKSGDDWTIDSMK